MTTRPSRSRSGLTLIKTRGELRRLLLNDPVRFLQFLFPTLHFKPFHCEWLRQIASNRLTLTLAPRGHAKTTVIVVAEIVRRLLRDPDRRVLLVSNTQDQAQAIYRMIRDLMSTAVAQGGLFKGHVGRCTANELWMAGRRIMQKEANLTALGVFGALTLRHFEEIFVDDAIDFENTRTYDQRRKFREWVGTTLLPTLEPDGMMHWVGTRYHADDFYGAELLDKGKYPDIVWNEGTHRAINSDASALWPERFSIEELEARRRKQGPAIFAAQYQNDVSLMRGSIFRQEWLKYYEKAPDHLAVYIGFDPAISQKDHADYSALVAVGRLGADLFVLDCQRGRWTFEEQIRAISSATARWRPVAVAIEDVGYQRALIETVQRHGLPATAVPRRADKVARAYAMQGLFESGNVHMPAGGRLMELESELLAFPESEHDDQFDAMELAVQQARMGDLTIWTI